ncbi:hypothetical protein CEW89_08585 [Celeribacter ethanolicus]|uniref:Uncharacterized protein n=1 Tax=Celeribacter ethanolicus TaxID=1758178 RepID=A0A291GBQ0_9RHOB|nr:hypothetical protein [Celeribacter ethanolicus]ATG47625.1 hypothetical protein CEW89_08585 [Celeribacter ethanolicus]
MSQSIPVDVLEGAARRIDSYMTDYGVVSTWEIHTLGLRFEAHSGANRTSLLVAWSDLASARLPGELIHNTEKAALAGLST